MKGLTNGRKKILKKSQYIVCLKYNILDKQCTGWEGEEAEKYKTEAVSGVASLSRLPPFDSLFGRGGREFQPV